MWNEGKKRTYDGGAGGPTLVMGASMVIEWIRAIEECLRWELPGRVKAKTRKILNKLTFEMKQNSICCFFCFFFNNL